MSLNVETAVERLSALQQALTSGEGAPAKSLVFAVSKEDAETYGKAVALQSWALGWNLTDTVIAVTPGAIHIIANPKKCRFLQGLTEGTASGLNVTLHEKPKGDNASAACDAVVAMLREAGPVVGVLPDRRGSESKGAFLEHWTQKLNDAVDTADMTAFVSEILAVKRPAEVQFSRDAGLLSALAMQKVMRKKILDTVDASFKAKHSGMADEVEKIIMTGKLADKARLSSEEMETCYTPVVQSGKSWSLKASAVADDSSFKEGPAVCWLGIKYHDYCANVGRTYIIEPTPQQEKDYAFLVEVQAFLLKNLTAGKVAGDLFEETIGFVRERREDLLPHMTKNLGFLTGIEFRDSSFVLKKGVSRVIQPAMVFNVAVGFQAVPNVGEEGGNFSVFLADTVLVRRELGPDVLTGGAKSKLEDIKYQFAEQDEEEEKKSAERAAAAAEAVAKAMGVDGKRRRAARADIPQVDASNEQRRKEHQAELARKLHEKAKRRLEEGPNAGDELVEQKEAVAYEHASQLPADECRKLRIFIDKKHEAVVLPIFNMMTPFHISLIKTVSQTDESDRTFYLRINFVTPGVTVLRSQPYPEEGGLVFLKEVVYRSRSPVGLAHAFRLIKELQKRYRAQEAERKEMEDLVDQEDLVLRRGTERRIVLRDLHVRPAASKKMSQGVLEAHQNGFRFTNRKGEKIDIIYNNIKHAFYQPCKNEVVILFHFHLKNGIVIGKKKVNDVQFYTEVGEVMYDLSNNVGVERDEIEKEQTEKKLRKQLSKMFEGFLKRVETMTQQQVEFDVPFYDLGFYGVPIRASCLLQPTTYCLVNLTEQPSFVLTLADVERVHFERADYKTKNFDMVWIYSDYSRKPAMISSIDIKQLEAIKNWLDSCDIKFTVGSSNFNWPKILKIVQNDFAFFMEKGGWDFLEESEQAQEEEEEEGGGQESDSAVSYGESELEELEESSEEYEESEEFEESEEEEEEEGEEEEAMSWDEMEREAAREDRETAGREKERERERESRKRQRSRHQGRSGKRPR